MADMVCRRIKAMLKSECKRKEKYRRTRPVNWEIIAIYWASSFSLLKS